MDRQVSLQLGNLHDAFLNASLQRDCMLKSPAPGDPEAFMISDRGRFERTWLAFLYILVECWRSEQMAPVRECVYALVPDCRIDELLREGDQDGRIAKLRDVRHYMCHRDHREYWDEGRLAVAGELEFNSRLHSEFGRVLLLALRTAPAAGGTS